MWTATWSAGPSVCRTAQRWSVMAGLSPAHGETLGHRVSRAQRRPLCGAGLSSGIWEEVLPGSLCRVDMV